MKKFEKIIDDPLFFKWVFNSNEEIETYWKKYMDENPGEVDFILETKSDLKKLKHSNELLSMNERKQLSANILHSLDVQDKKSRKLRIIRQVAQYAAVAILFSAISGVLVYFQMGKSARETFDQLVISPVQINEPTLILSESDKISLQKSESTVDYSGDGEIVLNEERVIKSVNKNIQEPKINQLVIPFGSRSKVSLSDGTNVWLNAGSRLVYPSFFKGKTREVTLYGEAFFDVSHDEEKPFIVKTTSLDVRVLGTQFNVSAYPEDKIIRTVLQEGKVAIRKKGSSLFERDLILEPNQLSVYHKETSYSTVYNVNAADYTIWVKGLLRFEDEEFGRVVRKVERYYNTWISYEKSDLTNVKISGKLDLNRDVEEVLEYLAKVSRSNYEEISENKYLLK